MMDETGNFRIDNLTQKLLDVTIRYSKNMAASDVCGCLAVTLGRVMGSTIPATEADKDAVWSIIESARIERMAEVASLTLAETAGNA